MSLDRNIILGYLAVESPWQWLCYSARLNVLSLQKHDEETGTSATA
jgi:hypothetical protein